VPSLQAYRLRLVNTLTRETGTRRRFGARQAFVVAQLAFSILLVVCALLLGQSLDNAYRIDPGFRTEGVEVAGIDLRLGGYEGERAAAFARTLVSRLEELPAIEAAASARVVPLTMEGFSGGRLWHPGDPRDDDHAIPVDWNIVTAGYFQTLEIPVLRGRRFSAADAGGSANVAIVNETLARRAWPGEDPVGRTILYGVSGRPLQIVGVARDAKYRTLGEPPRPFLYVPLAQHYEPELWLMIRSRNGSAIPALRELVRELDPNLPLVTTAALADMTAVGLLPNRAAMWVATSVGLIGLLLAAIGVYGITAYDVSRRTREIGVRVALGALRRQVMTLVVRRAMLLAAAGAALGMGLAAIAGRFLTALLYGVEPLDPVSFAAGAVLLATCALAASVAPALRAASSDPVTALRAE
jgi:putative ABC transport system permease protein